MRSMVYGAGSLGTILGACLSENGADVLLVSRNVDHIEALRREGAHIVGTVDRRVPVKACLPEEIEGTFDVIYLLTKQQDNPAVARFLRPLLAEGGVVCTLQNGIPELGLRESLDDGQILGGIISWSATWKGPGVSELTSPADSIGFTIGSPFGVPVETVERVAEHLSLAGPTQIDGDLLSARWSKLLVNAAISALSSSLDLPCGGATHDPSIQPLTLRLLREVIDVGHAQGVTFRPVGGYPIAQELYAQTEEERRSAAAKLPSAFDSIQNAVSGVLQDLRKGRVTEVRDISGVVCRAGRAVGVPTPCNDRVVEVIEKIQRGELPLSPDNRREYQDLLTE